MKFETNILLEQNVNPANKGRITEFYRHRLIEKEDL